MFSNIPCDRATLFHLCVCVCVPAVSGKRDGGQAVRNRVMHQQQHGQWHQHGRVDDHGSADEAEHKQQHAPWTHGRGRTLQAAQHPLTHRNNPISIGSADDTHPSTHRCVRVCVCGSAASQCCDIIRSTTYTHRQGKVKTGFAAAFFFFFFYSLLLALPSTAHLLSLLGIESRRCRLAHTPSTRSLSLFTLPERPTDCSFPYAPSPLAPQLHQTDWLRINTRAPRREEGGCL